MIERYLYSIPTRKKIFYGALITGLFLSLMSYRVNAGIFTWIAGTVTDNITDEIFTAINQSIGEAVGALIDWFFNVLLEPLGPQLTTFTTNTNFASVSLADFIDRFSIFTGMFLATLIFGFGMCIYFLSGKITESRDTPISLFAKYCIAVAICYKHKTIYTTIMNIIDEVFSSMTYNLTKDMMKKEGFLNIVAKTADDKLTIFAVEQAINFAFPGVGLIVIILQIILIWKLIKGFLKLYCEMVSRYIVTIVLLLLFAAFGGTIVSNNTSSIFKSYLRTLFSSFIVMMFNMVWFKGCFFAVLGGNRFTFIQYIFVLELLAFGLKFDGMLRSMGLGVATGGSRIGNAISGAGRNIANALRMANDARKAGGSLLQARGLATNNPDLFNLGTKLAASPFDAFKPGHGGIMHMAATHGAQGTKIDDSLVSPKEAAEIMSFASNNPGNRDAMNALNGLSKNSILAGAKYMAGQNGIKVNDAKVCQFRGADGKMHSGIKIDGEKAQLNGKGKPILDKDGNVKTHKVSGIISDENAFDSSQKIGDDKMGMGLHCNNSLKNGETCRVADAADVAGQSAADALQKSGIKFSDDAYIEKDGVDGNKQDAFNVYDNGKQVGTIAGGEFTAAADINSANNDDLRKAEAKEEVKNGPDVSDVGDMKATGFTATARTPKGVDTPLNATFTPNADGTTTATFTNTATKQTSSFNVPTGTPYSDVLSSEKAKSAASNVSGGGKVSEFTPTKFSATAYDSGSAQTITASVVPNNNGSSTATITGQNGKSESFNIPKDSSFEEALASDEGQKALSSVTDGGNTSDFAPTRFSATAMDENGTVSSLSARFEENDDGTARGIITNNATKEEEPFDVPSGTTFDNVFSSDEAQNAISTVSGGATVSEFTPSEYSGVSLNENASGSTLSASFEDDGKGTTTGTITNASTRESETFSFPSGTSYEDALSSSDARDAIRKVSDSDVVSGFTPTEFGATSASDSGYDETTVSAQFTPNADGSTRATFTNTENGTSTSFDVPDGTSYSDALSSDEAKSAVSSITSGGTAESFSPNEYVMPVTKEDGSRENYSVHFDGKDDGTYDAQITDSRGHSVGSYTSNDDTYGNGIRDAIENDKERCGSYDSISSFAPVEGSPGVYQATATKGETQTVITATDKGMYAESSKNDDPRSFMYVSETDSGTRVAYDVNFGRSYDSTQKNYSNSKTYNPVFDEEQQLDDEARERTFNNEGRTPKPKIGQRKQKNERK